MNTYKYRLLFIALILALQACNSSKKHINYEEKKYYVGERIKTSNHFTPYIYRNGFRNYEIKSLQYIHSTDTITFNELRFNDVESAFYIQNILYNEYGMWDKEVWVANDDHPILIWESIKLFDDSNDLFTIAASGEENFTELFSSVQITNSNGYDYLSKSSELKHKFILYFVEKIINLKQNKNFYNSYWKMHKDYSPNKSSSSIEK